MAQESTNGLVARLQALSSDEQAALRQQAKAHLTAAGVAPGFQIAPVVEAALFELLASLQG